MNWTTDQLAAKGYQLNQDGSYSIKPKYWSEPEKQKLIHYYQNTPENIFDLSILAKDIGRSMASIHCKANELNVTSPRGVRPRSDSAKQHQSKIRIGIYSDQFKKANDQRIGKPNKNRGKQIWSEEQKKQISERSKQFIKENGHPKGMLGKTHTQQVKDNLSKLQKGKTIPIEQIERTMKTKVQKYGTLAPNVKRGSWKSQWAEIGGKKFYARSSWEITHANWLQSIKEKQIIKDWNHEPKTFWFTGIKRGAMSYLPDFELTLIDNTTEYHEVKGWMDSRSKTKIKRFRKQYPQFQLRIFGKSNDPLIQFKIPQSYLITDYNQLQQATSNQ